MVSIKLIVEVWLYCDYYYNMKLKFTAPILTLLIVFSLFFQAKISLAFTFDSIGSSTINNQKITSWSFSGTRPTFRGSTDPGGPVIITIDGVAVQVSADSAGAWVYTPVNALSAGVHTVIISANGVEMQNFQLTITAGALPATGATTPTIILLGLGAGSVVLGRRFLKA